MGDNEPKGPIRNVVSLLTRWFASDEQPNGANAPSPADGSPLSEQQDELLDLLPEAEIPKAVSSISEKLTVLKKSFEFDKALSSRLDEVRSHRELLLYMYEILLARFAKIHEIGLMTGDSFQVVQRIRDKTTAMLSNPELSDPEESSPAAEDLRKENSTLKEEIAAFQKRYVKSGIITDTELALEKEVTFLQSKLREQQSKIKLAAHKIKALKPYHEMWQTLRAKNSLLQSRVDHQGRLLRSLTANEPKQRELLSTVERLNAENRQLRTEVEKQAQLLTQLKETLPPDARHLVDGLIDSNTRLRAELGEKQEELQGALSAVAPGEDLLESIERLTDENTQLKTTLDAQYSISAFLEENKAGRGNPEDIVDKLRQENERLGIALEEKNRQIEILKSDSSETPAGKAYWQLQQQYRELFKENQVRERMSAQQEAEKRQLLAQARERTALIRENQRLKTQVESLNRYIQAMKKLEHESAVLKRERGEFRAKFEALSVENTHLKQKLSKLSGEYQLLIQEYENIFALK